jgi:hypothetical protein
MLETDNTKLAGKIDFAIMVLQACVSNLSSTPENTQQRSRMEDALRTLDAVRRIELGACA